MSIASTTAASSDAQKPTSTSVQTLSFAEWEVSGKMPTYCQENCSDITMYRILQSVLVGIKLGVNHGGQFTVQIIDLNTHSLRPFNTIITV